jgi:hypothetical protein
MRPQPADGFEWVDSSYGPMLRCRPLAPFAEHVFTTRGWSIGSPDGSDSEKESAWNDVARALAVGPSRLRRVRQVHGAAVSIARCADPPASGHDEADILVTGDATCALAIQTADCVPILLADTRTSVVGAAHAGWRGLAARVPLAAVAAMAERFGSRPEDLAAAIGPSISAERYEVGVDVRDRFRSAGFDDLQLAAWFPTMTRDEHWTFDGWLSASDQLAAAGVPRDRIHVARLCTATYPDLFCSYRRDGTRAGRMAAAIRALAR